MISDYDAREVLRRGYLACSGDNDEAERQADRFLDAIAELLDASEKRARDRRRWGESLSRPPGVTG